ncbi:MBL fold metallo-hydrolase [Algoriphagus aquimarinus]|uniref:Pyrroloquinoline quinone biosynthesis protein B n=1 Tax=Algoriphagus aquimarinus TaxID=237018 RepID=A0A1I1B2M3_9BACT|nr:MBL fold metallo-hydrolase [Algoriphagus aquimarinus]SFB44594.1 pyrroloquinoline quinone biosynthesis protein B [Algoriphagus aquimarinus]
MEKSFFALILLSALIFGCDSKSSNDESFTISPVVSPNATAIVVLGTIQDGGSPHIGCDKECCKSLFDNPDKDRQVVSLGLYDVETKKKYLFEATPDISRQVKALKNFGEESEGEMPDGVFLTHAHIGHYAGLMYLGKEARDAKGISVFAMPKMKEFLQTNGPWSQLVSNANIELIPLENGSPIALSKELKVTPLQVPHRDEYSETVGYKIEGPTKTALFIPDIDKWEKWERDIFEEIKTVDYAFVDATFFSGKELNNRDMAEIPHPFILESMAKFDGLSSADKAKVIFIHFNHTNPVIDPTSAESKLVLSKGFRIARIKDVFEL